MTPVSFFSASRRRAILMCCAVIVLHLLLLWWLEEHLGPSNASMAKPPRTEITAQLIMAPPPAPKPPPKPQPHPKPKPHPKPAPKPKPPPPREPEPLPLPLPPPSSLVSDALAPDVADTPAVVAGPSVQPAAAPQAPPPPAPVPPAPQPAEPAPVAARRYNVDLPAPADFDMELRRVDADGTKWSGVAAMSWKNSGDHYKVTMEAGLSMLITRINLLVLTSEGEIDDGGIAPLTATEKRKGRSMTATHFNRADKVITFSASTASYPLPAGAQDKASLPFQLAGIGRADINQLSGDLDIFVGEDTDASLFRFKLVGQEDLNTRMGSLTTWHLSRPPKPGSYSSQLDIWLAPSQDWYPVQIRNTEASGAVTTQTVTKITVTEPSGK